MSSHEPLTKNEIIDLLKPIVACDGHERGAPDVAVWMLAARNEGWRMDEAEAAVIAVVSRFTGYRIMPGHVSEQIHADRRQPGQLDGPARAEIEGPPPASASHRAAQMAQVVDLLARRKAMPSREEIEREERQAAQARLRAMWDVIAACTVCDDGGMVLVRGVEHVCQHPGVDVAATAAVAEAGEA
jgi:hypothetical protein